MNDEKSKLIEILHNRASVRNYSERKIEPEILDQIFKAAVHGPSGGNLQLWSIIKIQDQEVKDKLGEMVFQKFISKAPLNLLFCMDLKRNEILAGKGFAPYTARKSFRHFWISFQDTVIAAQNICVAADAFRIGSCYIGTIMEFHQETVEMFKLPEGVYPVVLVSLGYPKGKYPEPRKKFSADIMVHDEVYQDRDPDELWEAFQERENHRIIEINEQRMKDFKKCCRDVLSPQKAEKCIEQVKKQNGFNVIQYLFGLHYEANGMPVGNLDFLENFKNSGFSWMEKSRFDDIFQEETE
jgi:nitroreductase